MALGRLEAEKRGLQEELSRVESRSTKLELQRMSTEGDLQRLQMMLQEKDATIQVIIIIFNLYLIVLFTEITREVRSSKSNSCKFRRTLHVFEINNRSIESFVRKSINW